MSSIFGVMRDGGSSDETLEWVEHADKTAIIPFDGRAFWRRIRGLVGERFPDHDSNAGCIEWLNANVEAAPRTFNRWCNEGRRPRWKNVREVRDALNEMRPPGTAELTLADLVRGLPGHKATASEPGDDTSPGTAAGERAETPGDGPGERDLDGLLAKVREALRKAPALAAALADKGYSRADVAGALVKRPAMRVAMDLAELVRAHGDAAREVLWHILPLIGDWDDLLRQARAAGSQRGTLELRLCTETVAEIVIARAEARACLFAPGDTIPQGAAHVPLPAKDNAPFFDPYGAVLVEAVLTNLWEGCGSVDASLPDKRWWQDIRDRFRSKKSFAKAATKEIDASARLGPRRYLLVIDEKLDPDNERDMDASWAVAQEALGAALPGLRLVRLKGRLDEMNNEDEYDIVPYIREVRDRS